MAPLMFEYKKTSGELAWLNLIFVVSAQKYATGNTEYIKVNMCLAEPVVLCSNWMGRDDVKRFEECMKVVGIGG